jgi:hypothetical protein
MLFPRPSVDRIPFGAYWYKLHTMEKLTSHHFDMVKRGAIIFWVAVPKKGNNFKIGDAQINISAYLAFN